MSGNPSNDAPMAELTRLRASHGDLIDERAGLMAQLEQAKRDREASDKAAVGAGLAIGRLEQALDERIAERDEARREREYDPYRTSAELWMRERDAAITQADALRLRIAELETEIATVIQVCLHSSSDPRCGLVVAERLAAALRDTAAPQQHASDAQ